MLQYKKDKFEGYIYGDTKNEEKSFKASSVEKIEKDTDWELKVLGKWSSTPEPRCIIWVKMESRRLPCRVSDMRIAVRSCGSIVRHRDGAKLALHLLAGPIERLYAKLAGDQYTESGIMQIDLKKTANTNGVERAAAYSFARDLSGKNGTLEVEAAGLYAGK